MKQLRGWCTLWSELQNGGEPDGSGHTPPSSLSVFFFFRTNEERRSNTHTHTHNHTHTYCRPPLRFAILIDFQRARRSYNDAEATGSRLLALRNKHTQLLKKASTTRSLPSTTCWLRNSQTGESTKTHRLSERN